MKDNCVQENAPETPGSCLVSHICQDPKWPSGCECVSTVMLLQYLGCEVSVDEFIKYLPLGNVSEERGVLFGDDPNECFIGSPYEEEDSYGCYAGTIIHAVNQFAEKSGYQLKVTDVSQFSTEELIRQYIAKGLPVIYWATIGLLPSFSGSSWRLRKDGSLFTWVAQEHCMLLIGEDDENYLFSDPWYSVDVKAYPKNKTKKRHEEVYSMAVAVERIDSI